MARDRKTAKVIFVSVGVGLLIGLFILGRYVVPLKEVVKEVEAAKEVEVVEEVPMTLPTLAEKIRKGEIDVGEEYGMAPDQRFHQIHATAIGMECTQCHVEEAPLEVALPSIAAPGPIDRRVCLGCHMTGPAFGLYVPQE